MQSFVLRLQGEQLLPTHTQEGCVLQGETVFWAEVFICLLAFPSYAFCTTVLNFAILFKEHKGRVNYYLGVEETVEWEMNQFCYDTKQCNKEMEENIGLNLRSMLYL